MASHHDPFADMWGNGRAASGPATSPRDRQRQSSSPGIGGGGDRMTSPRIASAPVGGGPASLSPRGQTGTEAEDNAAAVRRSIADRMYKRLSEGPVAHQPKAKPKRGGLGLGGGASRPQLLVCYLCGQQFGTASLDIHQPQCYVKKLLQWERNPSEFRGVKPLSPEEYNAKLSAGGHDLKAVRSNMDKFNEIQFEGYTDQLVPCMNCGRTFLPDRLEVHSRSCKGPGKGSKPVRRLAPPPSGGETRSTTTPEVGLEEANRGSGQRQRSASPTLAAARAERRANTSTEDQPIPRRHEDRNEDSRTPTDPMHTEPNSPTVGDHGQDAPSPVSRQKTASPPRPRSTSASKSPRQAGEGNGPVRSQSPKVGGAPRMTLHERMLANLVRCQHCNRTFAPDRIEKHESVCLAQKSVSIAKKAPPPAATAAVEKKAVEEKEEKIKPPTRQGSGSSANNSFGGPQGFQRSVTEVRRSTGSGPPGKAAAAANGSTASTAKVAALSKESAKPTLRPVAGTLTPPPSSSPITLAISPSTRASGGVSGSSFGAPSKTPPHLGHANADGGVQPPSSPTLEASFSELQLQLQEMDNRRRARVSASVDRVRMSGGAGGNGSPPLQSAAHGSGNGVEGASSPDPRHHSPLDLPPAAAERDRTPVSPLQKPMEPASKTSPRMRFCGECGAKLVSDSQKFCCECGAKLAGN